MKLEPVYLVAPPSTPKSATTRRAFLLASCAAVGAGTVGFASGVLLRGTAEPAHAAEPSPEDARLKWLYELCDDATPIETLIQYRASLMISLRSHREDPILRHGVERIAAKVIGDPSLAERRRLATELLIFVDQELRGTGFDSTLPMLELREVARGR